MKYLTLVFAGISFCFSGLVRAEVFYCSEDNRAGIKWDESRPVTFKPGRLKINVDFENNTLHSPDATCFMSGALARVVPRSITWGTIQLIYIAALS